MICALIERVEEGYRCDAQFIGYGNHTLGEAFKMEGIDIEKELEYLQELTNQFFYCFIEREHWREFYEDEKEFSYR